MVRILERATKVDEWSVGSCLSSPQLVGRSSWLTQKAQEVQVACGSEWLEALVHVRRNLPGAMLTTAHQVCPEVSETSSTPCGIHTSPPGHSLSISLGAEAASCL